jgi:1-acyl-sn-glycerol-3-phosphate acyltransferase
MSDNVTPGSAANVRPPTKEDVERRLGSLRVRTLRPLLWAGIHALCVVRRFGWTAEGTEHIEDLDGPVLFAANHQSHVDTAAIIGTLPKSICKRTVVAAALDVFGHGPTTTPPSLKREMLQLLVAAGFHAFAFDRHGPALPSLRTSTQLVRNGWNLLLYPEGTRSRTGQISDFKAGVGILARFTNRPVVPVFTYGGREILPCGAFMPRAARAIVRYGKPIWLEKGESAEAFTDRIEQAVRALGALSPRYASAVATRSADVAIDTDALPEPKYMPY